MKTKLFFIASAIVLLSACSQETPDINKYVTDCEGNVYPVVKIGYQYWMAENLKCTKYDTKSEKAGQTLSTSDNETDAPYYTDGRQTITDYSDNLTDAQREKFGLLYNWAAAAGLTESESTAQTVAFDTIRQGICPNGYHLPTSAEWDILTNYCGGEEVTGDKIKTTTGWYNDGNGTDSYGLAVLPSGYASGGTADGVGSRAYFWSSDATNDQKAYETYIYSGYGDLSNYSEFKYFAQSVRCVRDN